MVQGIDPIVTAAQIVTSAQVIVSRQLDINKNPAVVTFGIFNGGQRFNIVPDHVDLQGTVRAFDEGMRKQALASLKNFAEHIAAANGATVGDADACLARAIRSTCQRSRR